MSLIILGIVIVVSIPVYKWLYNRKFDSREDFYQCLGYFFVPDSYSYKTGDWNEDRKSQSRIGGFISLVVLITFFEYIVIGLLLELIKGVIV